MSHDDLKRQYRWQCRRGASEAEVVLFAYLDDHFDNESPEHQAWFPKLLACEDADTVSYTHLTLPTNREV